MVFQLYAFGSNGSGQLGIGHANDVDAPAKCVAPSGGFVSRPIQIAAGGNHTLIRCEDGTMFASGSNEGGRCGWGATRQSSTEFHQVRFTSPCGEVITRFDGCAATWDTSVFLTATGSIYTCGFGAKGRLGQGERKAHSFVPHVIPDFPPPGCSIVCLAACMTHTAAILSTGEAYAWGAGRKGQLGHPACDVWKPRRIEELDFIAERVICGRDFTYIVGSSTNGRHIILGDDKWKIVSSAPDHVKAWRDVVATWSSIYVHYQHNDLVCWGRNDNSQLPQRSRHDIVRVIAGSEHVLIEDGTGKILAFGWGEHGNCGPVPSEHSGISPMHATISNPLDLHLLGGGCATSWLVSDGDQHQTP